MISIVVPAHNESSVIARTLSQWVGNPASDEIGVVVVCNGCTDDTANVARRFGPTVHVVESDIAGKTHALNLGDQISDAFPRIYADADIVITVDAIRALARRLEQGDVLAVAPTADINLTGCSWLVRKYLRNSVTAAVFARGNRRVRRLRLIRGGAQAIRPVSRPHR